MTRKAAKTAARTQPKDSPALDNLAQFNKEAVETVDEMTHSVAETFETFSEETLDFMRRRFDQDLAVPQKLIGCWTPQEAMGVYLDFVRNAQRDYIDEANRMARLSQGITQATLQMMRLNAAARSTATRRTGTRSA